MITTLVGQAVGSGSGDAVEVRVAVGVLVTVGVRVAVGVFVAVGVRVAVGVLVTVGVRVAVGAYVAVDTETTAVVAIASGDGGIVGSGMLLVIPAVACSRTSHSGAPSRTRA